MPPISNPPPHPSAWLCKFCYQAYRWIFSYYFHTLISLQPHTIMSRDAENFCHVFRRCITSWQKIPFLFTNQSTTTLHSSHVMCPSPKSSHFLARTNHHRFLVLYFCTNLSDWVSSFSNFHYEHLHIIFINFSETTLYVICFLHHIQASYVLIRHTDFSQNMAAIYSSELTPYFISQPHIHFCRFP